MVSDNSPEWLPSGWTMQVRDRNGRRIKSYLDPESGRKFYSKPEVSRYLETVKNSTACDKSPKPHGTTADSSTKQDYNQGNEIPDPSPEGQPIEQQNGDKYTDGVDCLTGDGDLSESAASQENEVSDWLPDGWIMEVKTQKVGTKLRLIYKCFTEPESGRKFLSKSQVLSYLSNKNSSESRQREACTDTRNEVSEWLPDGWIMEVKTCTGGTREYKCYTNPASGRKFFSKRKVLNYLATTNSSGAEQIKGDKASSKPDKAQNSEAIDVSRNKSKKKTVIPKVVSSEVVSRTPADGLPPGWIKEIRIRKYAQYTTKDPYYLDPLSGYMFRSKPDALRYLDTGDIRKCIIKPKKRNINEELPSICAADGLKPVSTDTRRQLFQGKEASSDAAVDSIKATVNLEENHTHEKCIDPETQALLIAENTSVSTPPNDILQEIETPEEKIAEHSKQMNTSKKKSTFTLPARSSKRLKGLEPEIKCDPLLNEQAIRAAARVIPKQFEEQLEKETMGSTRPLDNNEAGQDGKARTANVEEQTDDGNAESQISSLLGDPCLEFAIKTLRGEIPVDSPLISMPYQQGSVSLETSKNERQTKVN